MNRLRRELESAPDAPIAQVLREEAMTILLGVGAGPEIRPSPPELAAFAPMLPSEWLASGLEAMGWVSEERGLGGERSLDGLAWSLTVDRLWEAWVERILEDLAGRLGGRLLTARRGDTRRPLAWSSRLRSLGYLAPDAVLVMPDHHVLVDAKYKAHLMDIAHDGWENTSETVREAHRADLHQALAYSALADVERVDTVLAYPAGDAGEAPAAASADLASGRRRVRLHLLGLPFGFSGPGEREATASALERRLRAS